MSGSYDIGAVFPFGKAMKWNDLPSYNIGVKQMQSYGMDAKNEVEVDPNVVILLRTQSKRLTEMRPATSATPPTTSTRSGPPRTTHLLCPPPNSILTGNSVHSVELYHTSKSRFARAIPRVEPPKPLKIGWDTISPRATARQICLARGRPRPKSARGRESPRQASRFPKAIRRAYVEGVRPGSSYFGGRDYR
jgi:hypothetical protein